MRIFDDVAALILIPLWMLLPIFAVPVLFRAWRAAKRSNVATR